MSIATAAKLFRKLNHGKLVRDGFEVRSLPSSSAAQTSCLRTAFSVVCHQVAV